MSFTLRADAPEFIPEILDKFQGLAIYKDSSATSGTPTPSEIPTMVTTDLPSLSSPDLPTPSSHLPTPSSLPTHVQSVTLIYDNKCHKISVNARSRYLDVKKEAKEFFCLMEPLNQIKLYMLSGVGKAAKASPLVIDRDVNDVEAIVLEVCIVRGPSFAIVPDSGLRGGVKIGNWTRAGAPKVEVKSAKCEVVVFLDTQVVRYLLSIKLGPAVRGTCQQCESNMPTATAMAPILHRLLHDTQMGTIYLAVTDTVLAELEHHWNTAKDGVSQQLYHAGNQWRHLWLKTMNVDVVTAGIDWRVRNEMVQHIAEAMQLPITRPNDINDTRIFLEAGVLAVGAKCDSFLLSNNLIFVDALRQAKEIVEPLLGDYGISRWIDIVKPSQLSWDEDDKEMA